MFSVPIINIETSMIPNPFVFHSSIQTHYYRWNDTLFIHLKVSALIYFCIYFHSYHSAEKNLMKFFASTSIHHTRLIVIIHHLLLLVYYYCEDLFLQPQRKKHFFCIERYIMFFFDVQSIFHKNRGMILFFLHTTVGVMLGFFFAKISHFIFLILLHNIHH